jgi:phosphoenolpyruvate synthase/pyruvate phosphate dikinase
MEENIPKEGWLKYWEAPLTPIYPFFSLQLDNLSNCIDGLKTPYTKIFLSLEKGIMSCYYQISDVKRFEKFIVEHFLDKTNITLFEEKVENLLQKISKLKEITEFNNKDIDHLVEILNETHVYVGAIKVAGDASVNEETFKRILELRKKTEKVYFNLEGFLQKIASQISSKESIPKEEAMALSYNEIKNYFKEHNLPPLERLQKRNTHTYLYITPFGFTEIEEKDAKDILDEIHKESNSKILKGQTAFKGKVTGHCKVIRDFTINIDFPKGAILVTGMTDPRFVPIMEKASAIITDAGGMLCHAAIVSREMKIPCVVGTRVATSAIKTGDLVEVNADEGVVKRLS